MSQTHFPSPINNAVSTLAAAYTVGATSVTLATGYGATINALLDDQGLPAISATAPLRFRLASVAALDPSGFLINPALSALYQATSLIGDVLGGLSVVEGSTDQNFAAGDQFAVVNSAGLTVLQNQAINALQTGLPTSNATFIVQIADEALPAAQDLGSLATGLLKNTTATGVLSIATAGTDYLTPTGNGSGLTNLTPANITAGTAAIDISGNAATATTATTAGNVSGTVAIANGGTGQTSAAAGFNALSPLTTLGDVLYASGVNAAARLAGNTTTSKRFLTQTGTGAASAAPAWAAIATSDVSAALGAGSAGTVTWALSSDAGGTGRLNSTSNATRGPLQFNVATTLIDANGNLCIGAGPAQANGLIRFPQQGSVFYRSNDNTTDMRLFSTGQFHGTSTPDAITIGGGSTPALSLQTSGQMLVFGDVTIGTGVLTTTSTKGFGYLSTVAGTPTGTPTAYTGYAPILIDTTGSKLWVYIGGAWKSTTLA